MAIPPPPQGQQPPPYGQGAPPPYGWQQPYPYAQQQPSTNGLAITSMVLGILCLLPPLGLILGLVALSQIKQRGQRGKGMAVAGVTLSAIGTAFIVLAISLGWAASFWGGSSGGNDGLGDRRSAFSLAEGDCFDADGGKLEGVTTDVDVLDCDAPHDGEVYGTFLLDDGAYPSDSEVAQLADERCGALAEEYFGDASSIPDNLYEYYFFPDSTAWSQGERTVSCHVGDESGDKLLGSARDATGGSTGGDSGSTDGSTGGTTGGSTGGSTGSTGGSTGELEGNPGEGAEV